MEAKRDIDGLWETYQSEVMPKGTIRYTGAEQAAEAEREISRLEKELIEKALKK